MHRHGLASACVALSVMTTGCPHLQGDRDTQVAGIEIQRGPCFGYCPVYHVTLGPDDQVSFVGERHTALLGARDAEIYKGAASEIRNILEGLRPTAGTTRTLPCDATLTDTSTLTFRWTELGRAPSTLNFRMGCREDAGIDLEARLARALTAMGVDQWATQTYREGADRG